MVVIDDDVVVWFENLMPVDLYVSGEKTWIHGTER